MVLVLVVLFLVLPFAELAVIVQAADSIGLGWTLLALVAVSIAGGWLVKREGLGVVRRIQRQLDDGALPTTDLVDGAFILFAGALLMTPGFITDTVGLLLLLPPSRALIRPLVVRRLKRRVLASAGPLGGPVQWSRQRGGGPRAGGDVLDVDEVTPAHHDPARLGRRELEER